MSKKGYWIAEVDITDAEAFAGYVARVGPLLEKFGAKTIVRNGRSRSPEHPAGGTMSSSSSRVSRPRLPATRHLNTPNWLRFGPPVRRLASSSSKDFR